MIDNTLFMPKFTRTVVADAVQIVLTDEHKKAVKKGIPTQVHGGDLKHEDGKHIIPLHLNGQTVQAEEGDWIVDENGVQTLYTDEQFKNTFTSAAEATEPAVAEVDKSNTSVTETGDLKTDQL